MSEKNRNRRKILKGLVAGGGIAGAGGIGQWSKPVVESVVLPSHAATSVGPQLSRFSLAQMGGVITFNDQRLPGTQFAGKQPSSIVDLFVPKAHAISQQASSQLVLIGRSGGTFDFYVMDTFISFEDCIEEILATATGLTVGGGSQSLSFSNCSGPTMLAGTVEVLAVSDTDADISIFGGSPFTLMRDQSARPLSVMTPCPDCLLAE